MAVENIKTYFSHISGPYTAISSVEKPDEEDEASPQHFSIGYRLFNGSRFLSILPWVTTLLLTVACFSLMHKNSQHNHKFIEETKGYFTDFGPARPLIKQETVRFTGSLSIADNGTLFVPNPDPIKYVGEPSPEIEENWVNLTRGRYFRITEEEAKAAWGDDVEQFWDDELGGYITGIDMFHTLHCVNQIRELLYPEYYSKPDGNHKSLHRDHCLEQIRQYIMCTGDLTPIPTKYYAGLGRNYVDSDYPHTCRNFESLQSWMIDRYEGASMVKPSQKPHHFV